MLKAFKFYKTKENKNYIGTFGVALLRAKDYAKYITTPIREVNGKRQTICPFHSENTPSFFIFPNNSYHCFGCGAHGTGAIDFLMNKLDFSFLDACTELEKI